MSLQYQPPARQQPDLEFLESLPSFGLGHSGSLATIPEDEAFSFCQSEVVSDSEQSPPAGSCVQTPVKHLSPERSMQLELGCSKLQKTLLFVSSQLRRFGFERMRLSETHRHTFHNIEIENIAREKIIPYISEIFANEGVMNSSRTSTERSRSKSRSSMSRSRRESLINYDKEARKREFRFNVKMDRILKRLALRKGMIAIKAQLAQQHQQSQINLVEVSQSSFGSVMKDLRDSQSYSMSSSRRYNPRLEVKIIMKYTKKLVMAEAFERIFEEFAKRKVNKFQEVFLKIKSKRLGEGLQKIKITSRRMGACSLIGKALSKKIEAWEIRSKTLFLMRLKFCQKPKSQQPFKALAQLDRLITTKQIKLLYSSFYCLAKPTLKPSAKKSNPQIKQFFTTINRFIDKKLDWDSSDMADTMENSSYNRLREQLREITHIETKQEVSLQSKGQEMIQMTGGQQMFLEIGSSLPQNSIQQDGPLKSGVLPYLRPPTTRSHYLKPRPKDLLLESVNILESLVDNYLLHS